jgi:quinoprotein relay system zinc metallohydrolase 2
MAFDPLRRALLTGLAGAGLLALAPRQAPAATGLAVREIADGIFVFQGVSEMATPKNHGAVANLGFVVGREAVAAIDSGGSLVEGLALLAAIRATTDRPVRFLVATHMHPDHIFGNAAFRDAGATIVGHRNLPRALAARGDHYLKSYRRQLGEELMKGIEIVLPSMLVEDRLEIDLGGRVLELRAWEAAHTDNDVTIYDVSSKVLFAGDLVFLNHVPTLDGSLLGWMRQIPQLAAIPARAVVAGHGEAPADWPAALDPQLRYFGVLAGDLRQAIAAGTPLAKAVKTAGRAERDAWKLFDEYNERNATAAYAELEWE